MKRQSLLVLVVTATVAMALIYLGRLAFGSASLYSGALTDRRLLMAGGWTKLLALVVAAVFALRSTKLLGGGNAARTPWALLGAGLTALSLGQATLVYFQAFRGVSPFPSIADVWFVIAYPLLVAGVIAFIVAYGRSGFPMRGTTVTFLVFGAAAAAGAWPLLRPIVHSGDALLAKTLNIVYPALDLVLLVPVIVLLRMTSRFRGGAVWHVWCAMLAGFVFTAVGDILFAYFSTLGFSTLDPAVHAMYLVAYGGLAVGAIEQRRLLAA
jgi:diguanylate cyclase